MSVRVYDDWWTDLDEYAWEERRRKELEREQARLRQARIDGMRRIAPKGTYVPAKLAKAKRRVTT